MILGGCPAHERDDGSNTTYKENDPSQRSLPLVATAGKSFNSTVSAAGKLDMNPFNSELPGLRESYERRQWSWETTFSHLDRIGSNRTILHHQTLPTSNSAHFSFVEVGLHGRLTPQKLHRWRRT